jgi:hypothetical protein
MGMNPDILKAFGNRFDIAEKEVSMPLPQPASFRAKRILVAGDLSVDWFEVATPALVPSGSGARFPKNWRLFPGVHRFAKPGGAWLLADFIRSAAGTSVFSPGRKKPETIPHDELIHSYIELGPFPFSSLDRDKKNTVYRIKGYKGFTGPADGRASSYPMTAGFKEAEIVVLDDAGNGFRDEESHWPDALLKSEKPLLVVKMSRPLTESALLREIRKKHGERMVLIVTADDLRQEGIKLSRRLSWERTAKEFVWQMAANPALWALTDCRNIVVRFGPEGAIFYSRLPAGVESWLIYDPQMGEDGFGEVFPGQMIGLGSAFTAGLVAEVARRGLDGIKDGVVLGIMAARRLWQRGLGGDVSQLDYPGSEIFGPAGHGENSLAEVRIPNPTAAEPADPEFWCILNDLSRADLETIAYNFVLKGKDALLEKVPSGRFRSLRTFDRSEIESFRGIKNLIQEYLGNPGITRPLSIAVFGAPGSGKSFGVNEVAESVAPGKLQKIEFNMSQLNSPDELVAAFHRVRDIALGGKTPIVFFDEFDSGFHGPLGWLKYFLAPMQDGLFSDGRDVHPIGRAIFVFAGGTCWTYGDFCRGDDDLEFKNAKGPDFISRLRGYVNIKGPNPVDQTERLYLIRRAQVLRFQLEKNAPGIFARDGNCRIDAGVLRAMIKVPEYRHGIRSILAVIEMSMLAGRQSFEQAALPSPEQLELHVDAGMFSRLVERDVLLGSAREVLAIAIQEKYRQDNKGKRSEDDPAMRPWAELTEELRESNRRQADHIPLKLKAIGCDFAPVVGVAAKSVTFSMEEIEIMAKMEHERFVAERLLQGFRPGPRDPLKKTSPYLVPWEKLTKGVKEYDRQAVRAIPELLASKGFEVYRLKAT